MEVDVKEESGLDDAFDRVSAGARNGLRKSHTVLLSCVRRCVRVGNLGGNWLEKWEEKSWFDVNTKTWNKEGKRCMWMGLAGATAVRVYEYVQLPCRRCMSIYSVHTAGGAGNGLLCSVP